MKLPKIKIIEFNNTSEYVCVVHDGKYYLWTKEQLAIAHYTVESINQGFFDIS